MKKILIASLIGVSMILSGCGESKPNSLSNKIETKQEAKELKVGDTFTAKNEQGTYEVKVLSAKYLGQHHGDDEKRERVQVTWEINNIDFKGEAQSLTGETENDNVSLEGQDLKVKDNDGYVLDLMNVGWDGDIENDYKNVKIGDKMIKKSTWKLNKEDSEYLIINYNRMGNSTFKVGIDR